MSARRSAAIQLTLLPLLATAAAAANEPQTDPVSPPGLTPPIGETGGVVPADPARELGPQDMTFMPPGLTPDVDDIDCDEVPYWEYVLECEPVDEDVGDGGVIRGGFGSYFWSGGG